jgi:hypothetical protein
MALKAIIDAEAFAALPAEVQEHYGEETDGNHTLDVTATNGLELADNSNLKKTLQRERTAKEKLEKRIAPFEGIDPKAAKDALAKIDELAELDPEAMSAEAKAAFEKKLSDKFEADRNTLTKKHETEMGEVQGTNKKLTGQLESLMIKSTATRAIAEAKGSVDLLYPIIRENSRVVSDDEGNLRVEIIDPDTKDARLSPKAGSTELMTIEEYVGVLKETDRFARAFDGTGSSGSGATGSDGDTGSNTYSISSTDAMDPAKYRAASAKAEKAGKTLVMTE